MSKDLVATTSAAVTTAPIQVVRAPKRTKNEQIAVPNDVAIKANALTTTSAQIRFFQKLGYKPSQIANILGIRPQHAYNVMNQVLKTTK